VFSKTVRTARLLETGRTATELRIVGGTELVLGFITVLAAVLLAQGWQAARTFVAFLRIGATVFVVVSYHTTGYLLVGVLHMLLPIFVLSVLNGNDQVDEYFGVPNRHPGGRRALWGASRRVLGASAHRQQVDRLGVHPPFDGAHSGACLLG
jgi:hypothetical protein